MVTTADIIECLTREARDCDACAERATRVAPGTHAMYVREALIFKEAIARIERLEMIEELL